MAAVQARAHRPDGDAENCSGFGVGHFLEIAEHDGLAIVLWNLQQGGLHGCGGLLPGGVVERSMELGGSAYHFFHSLLFDRAVVGCIAARATDEVADHSHEKTLQSAFAFFVSS